MEIESIIHHLKTGDDGDALLRDFNRLNECATEKDLPSLLQVLRAADSNWCVRELISEPVLRLGGVSVLPDVLRALEVNFKEGHDNDTLQFLLVEFAQENPGEVMKALDQIEPEENGITAETIDWLFEHCGGE